MKKKWAFVAVAVLLAAGFAFNTDALAKKRGGPLKGGPGGCDGECFMDGAPFERLQALGLDDKQTATVKAIHLKAKKSMIKSRADEQVASIELRELLAKDSVDMNAAEAQVKKIEGIRTERRLAHIKTREEIKTHLTPEQKKKFAAMAGMGPFGGGRGMMGGRCGKRPFMDGPDDEDEMGHGPHGKGMHPMHHKQN